MRMKKYALIGCEVFLREFWHAALQSEAAIDFYILPQGLHLTPDALREGAQGEIDAIESGSARKASAGRADYDVQDYDAILLGYGLCSNGVAGITAGSKPLIIPRGHDCITLLLGSMAAYQDCFEKHPGTYWYSSGWIERSLPPGPERSEALRKHYIEKYGEDKAAVLMQADLEQYASYRRAACINWNLVTAERDRAYTRKCAEFMGWDYVEIDGGPALMLDFLGGRWDNERFLTVAPGETIQPSHGPCVIAAKAGLRDFCG